MEKMARIVFDCPVENETVEVIGELRVLRSDILRKQYEDIDFTLDFLIERGVIPCDQRDEYREVIKEYLESKMTQVTERSKSSDTIHSDEIDTYLDLLTSDNS